MNTHDQRIWADGFAQGLKSKLTDAINDFQRQVIATIMAEQKPEWHVADRPPDDSREVLVLLNGAIIEVDNHLRNSKGEAVGWEYHSDADVTHWMEKPALPLSSKPQPPANRVIKEGDTSQRINNA
jgi:hypothetical protein